MLLLQSQMGQAVAEMAENPVLTEVVETANEMNLWDMAVKGGWVMLVLALLSFDFLTPQCLHPVLFLYLKC